MVIENRIRVAILYEFTTLNVMLLINNGFIEAADRVFSPRAMIISKNDGYFDNNFNLQRDELINASTLLYLSRDKYSDAQRKLIEACKATKPKIN